jgi:beta-1,4-mannosyl-glycoprotein beta-1,4-N-acetylglucosaminyltransferase
MIYDCFPFCHELELLEIRLHTLATVVDRFVLVESTRTHSGKPKPLFFAENRERFRDFLPIIDHLVVWDPPEGKDPWVREHHQRNYAMRALSKLRLTDVVHHSDVDEIPDPEVLADYDQRNGIFGLICFQSQFFLNCEVRCGRFLAPKIFPARLLETCDLVQIREFDSLKWKRFHLRGGWHFSYCGGIDAVMYKTDSFAHYDNIEPAWHDRQAMEKVLKSVEIGRLPGVTNGETVVTMLRAVDETFPRYIRKNEPALIAKGLIYHGSGAYQPRLKHDRLLAEQRARNGA